MFKRILVLLFVIFAASVSNAYADSDIFTSLAEKAGVIGKGMRSGGYMIAGLGLIVFSFMAIFNKISWKNLAYIMLSCFILSAMFGIINHIKSRDRLSSSVRFDRIEGQAAPGEPENTGGVEVHRDDS